MLEHQIKMGRDALFTLLASNNLLVKRRIRRISTTDSFHRFKKYPNIIRDVVPDRSNQIWVSDITYWKVDNSFIYINLITDAFSHKIVGYQLAQTLQAIATVKALRMAIGNLESKPSNLTHHSDRGIQYCSSDYVKLLRDNDIKISMTENGDPLENAIAERINGIIKNEYLVCYQVDNFLQAKELLKEAIHLYNQERPHMSIGLLKPNQVHSSNIKTEKKWKSYYKKNSRIVKQLQD